EVIPGRARLVLLPGGLGQGELTAVRQPLRPLLLVLGPRRFFFRALRFLLCPGGLLLHVLPLLLRLGGVLNGQGFSSLRPLPFLPRGGGPRACKRGEARRPPRPADEHHQHRRQQRRHRGVAPAPAPAARQRAQRPRPHRLAAQEPPQVVGQVQRRAVALAGVL